MDDKKQCTLAVGLTNETGIYPFRIDKIYKNIHKFNAYSNVMYKHYYMANDWRPTSYDFLSNGDLMKTPDLQLTSHNLISHSCLKTIEDLLHKAETLAKDGYQCNAVMYIISDASEVKMADITDCKIAIARAISSEVLESFVSVFIGIGNHLDCKNHLPLHQQVGFSSYEPVNPAEKNVINYIPEFVGQLIRHQNRALGTGGPAIDCHLDFTLHGTFQK